MGERANALAADFESAISEFSRVVRDLPEAKWAATSPEGWTVAATAQHVAGQFPLEMEFVKAAAEGTPMPGYNMDDINGKNDGRAANEKSVTKDQVLRTFKESGSSVAAYIRGLSDEQLDRKSAVPLANGAELSTEQIIKSGFLIDHVRGHLNSIETAG